MTRHSQTSCKTGTRSSWASQVYILVTREIAHLRSPKGSSDFLLLRYIDYLPSGVRVSASQHGCPRFYYEYIHRRFSVMTIYVFQARKTTLQVPTRTWEIPKGTRAGVSRVYTSPAKPCDFMRVGEAPVVVTMLHECFAKRPSQIFLYGKLGL